MNQNTPQQEETAAKVVCSMRSEKRDAAPRFYATFSPIEWRGVISATAQGSKTPERILRDAVREYLTRKGIIDDPPPGLDEATRAQNRVVVTSRSGGILRQFVCDIPTWAFDALRFSAKNDGQPIGRTCAAAIYHFAAHRGIEPPQRLKAETENAIRKATLAGKTDIPEIVQTADGGVRRILYLKQWERDAVRMIADRDGDTAARTIVHAIRHYATVRGIDPPPEYEEDVRRVRTERDMIDTPTPPATAKKPRGIFGRLFSRLFS